jgi:hypothetical protein
MKRILGIVLVLFMGTALTVAQVSRLSDVVVRLDGGAPAGGGGSGAPTDATYLTQTANASLSAEQALGALSTGILRVATTTGVVTSLTDSAGIAANLSDETGTGAIVFGTSPTITTPTISGAISFPDGTRQTFNPDGTAAGLNVGAQAGDPSTPSNGDLWYDSTANTLDARINGATVNLGAGGAAFDPTDVQTMWYRDDFNFEPGGSRDNGWTTYGAGSWGRDDPTTNEHPGIVYFLTSGGAQTFGIYRQTTEFQLGGGAVTIKGSFNFPTLATAGEDYSFRFGLMDSVSGARPVDGVFIEYDRSTSVNWACVAINNNTTTATASSTAVGTGWSRLEVRVNAAGNLAEYFVNGAEVWCSDIATNNPAAANRWRGVNPNIADEAGAGNAAIDVDYIAYKQVLTTTR